MRPGYCQYPSYLNQADIKPYFVPFRALTNKKYSNLLVAGKTMAQTFHANSGTRLHPVEWTTGRVYPQEAKARVTIFLFLFLACCFL